MLVSITTKQTTGTFSVMYWNSHPFLFGLYFKSIFLFCFSGHGCATCMHDFVCAARVCLEKTRGHWIAWNWHCRGLWASLWVLGIKASRRAVISLNCFFSSHMYWFHICSHSMVLRPCDSVVLLLSIWTRCFLNYIYVHVCILCMWPCMTLDLITHISAHPGHLNSSGQ